MTDDEAPKKPPSPAPVRSFPPVHRPSASPNAAPAAPLPETPETAADPVASTEEPAPFTTPVASAEHAVPFTTPAAPGEWFAPSIEAADNAIVTAVSNELPPPQSPVEGGPASVADEAEEEDPPSLESLVAVRATQVSEPLALEALGSAARLIANPISTAEAVDLVGALHEAGSAPTQDLPSPEVSFDEAPATTPSIPSPEPSGHGAPAAPPADGDPDDLAAVQARAEASVATRLVSSLMIAASLVMVLWHMQLTSKENANTGSRYATIESLVDYGTYNIDASRYLFTPDKVKAQDHFVSSKPPLLPTYGAGVYYLLKKITGYNITDNESIVVWTVGVFTGWLGHLVFLLYFYRLCRLLLVRQLAVLVTVATASFAYLGVAYATAINNHSVGAAFAVAGFYHAFRAKHGLGGTIHWVLAGAALGVLPAIDLSSLALTGLCGIYLATKSFRRTLLFYAPFMLPGILSQFYLAHLATGSYIPAYADAGMMSYKGSYFGGRRAGIDALFEPKTTYAFNVLLGHHGVFSMTPLFGFSLFEIGRRLWKRDKYRAETIVFTVAFTVVTAFYIYRTHNYGGWCVGMRWLVPVMPWLVLLFGMWLDRTKLGRVKWSLVVAAFAVSAFNVQDGLTSPFQFSVWHNFLENAPNRNRIGPSWVLSHPGPADRKKARERERRRARAGSSQ
jgi:hypothetical protein